MSIERPGDARSAFYWRKGLEDIQCVSAGDVVVNERVRVRLGAQPIHNMNAQKLCRKVIFLILNQDS